MGMMPRLGVCCRIAQPSCDRCAAPNRSRRAASSGNSTMVQPQAVACRRPLATDTLSARSLREQTVCGRVDHWGRVGMGCSRVFHRKDNGTGEGPVLWRMIRQRLRALLASLQGGHRLTAPSCSSRCVLCRFARHRISQGAGGGVGRKENIWLSRVHRRN